AILSDEAHGLAVAGVGAAQVGILVADLELVMINGTAGVIAVSAEADAVADEEANATAVALAGAVQAGILTGDQSMTLANDGAISVSADAAAAADSANAMAVGGIAAAQVALPLSP